MSQRRPKKGEIYIGTSGYNYKHWWSGVFYPQEVPPSKWLEYYCQYFKTVELNVTFYRLPRESVFQSWYRRTPRSFLFTLKGSRLITHLKRLQDCEEPLRAFVNGVNFLKEKAKVVLWQFPPKFKVVPERLRVFIELLQKYIPKLRHVFEFRDESWLSEKVYKYLPHQNFTICQADHPKFNFEIPCWGNFVYLRRHGASSLYRSFYSDEELSADAEKIKAWVEEGRDVFVYFNNDAKGYAVKNALTLKEMLKG
jgi:uncharacterized protein YecE (DUF72 family)